MVLIQVSAVLAYRTAALGVYAKTTLFVGAGGRRIYRTVTTRDLTRVLRQPLRTATVASPILKTSVVFQTI
jgi:hypothetical protein